MRFLALLLLCTAAAQADDKKDTAPTPIAPAELARTEPIDYTKDVQPILVAKCTVCHSGTQMEGKFDLGTHAGLIKGGKRGTAVVAGKPAESNLYLFAGHNKKPVMPPRSENNPLSSKEVAVFKLWIEQGAKGPVGPEFKVKAKVVVGFPAALVKPVRALAISPDKSTLAAGRGNQIHLFDAKTGDFRKSLADPELKTPDGKPAAAAHVSLVEAMTYSPDGKTLATGSFQEVILWDAEKGIPKQRLGGFAHIVTCLAYSSDGKYLAAGGGAPTEDGEVRVFNAAGQPILDLKGGHSDTVFGVSFNPDGKLLASAAADKFVKVFEIPSGKLTKSFEGHTQHVLDVGWAPDGKRLVSAGADNFVKIWDYEKGEKVRDIQGYKNQVTRLMFVGKTANFLTASGDANVRLINAENGGTMRTYTGAQDYVYAVAASPDGTLVAAGGEDGIARLYNGANGQLIKELNHSPAKKDEPKKDAVKPDPKKK